MSDTVQKSIKEMFDAGLHYGYRKARRHPSVASYIFGAKNGVEIFDLEKTAPTLEKAAQVIREIAARGKTILFVGGKLEARKVVRDAAESLGTVFVAGRWVGGTLTNFPVIRARVMRLEQLMEDKEKGELTKYTKKERLLIDREIKRLEEAFGGLKGMKELPAALFIIDPKNEKNAVAEARSLGIPVIALANTDCDISKVTYSIPGNDANVHSIAYVVQILAAACKEGMLLAPKKEHTEVRRMSERTDEFRGERRPRSRTPHAPQRDGSRPRHQEGVRS